MEDNIKQICATTFCSEVLWSRDNHKNCILHRLCISKEELYWNCEACDNCSEILNNEELNDVKDYIKSVILSWRQLNKIESDSIDIPIPSENMYQIPTTVLQPHISETVLPIDSIDHNELPDSRPQSASLVSNVESTLLNLLPSSPYHLPTSPYNLPTSPADDTMVSYKDLKSILGDFWIEFQDLKERLEAIESKENLNNFHFISQSSKSGTPFNFSLKWSSAMSLVQQYQKDVVHIPSADIHYPFHLSNSTASFIENTLCSIKRKSGSIPVSRISLPLNVGNINFFHPKLPEIGDFFSSNRLPVQLNHHIPYLKGPEKTFVLDSSETFLDVAERKQAASACLLLDLIKISGKILQKHSNSLQEAEQYKSFSDLLLATAENVAKFSIAQSSYRRYDMRKSAIVNLSKCSKKNVSLNGSIISKDLFPISTSSNDESIFPKNKIFKRSHDGKFYLKDKLTTGNNKIIKKKKFMGVSKSKIGQ